MGTTSEWMRVLEIGGFFGILMLIWDAITQREKFTRVINLLATALASFAFGMFNVFEWRAFHGGIAIIFGVVMLGLFAAGFAARRTGTRAEVQDVEAEPEHNATFRIPKHLR
jgi:hypothetical protein